MVQSDITQTPKTFLKTLSIIHLALIAGQVLFAITALGIKTKHQTDVKNSNEAFMFIVPLLALAGFVAGHMLFKQQVNKLSGETSLKEKIKGYQGAVIVRFALLEGPSLFAIVAFLLTKNLLFLLVSALIILYFISLRPTKEKTENDLNLSYEEKLNFDKEDESLT
jgi:hypothetical protein